MTRVLLLIVALSSAAASAQMLNEQGPPQWRVVHKNTLALRLNPLGLIYDGRFSVRYRLYESTSLALRDNFVGLGLAPTVSPAFLRVGPHVEFNPLSVLGLWAMFQFVQYFGTFDLAQGFAGAQSDFSDSAIKANRANKTATNGWELTLGMTLQAKVKAVVLRNQSRAVLGSLALKGDDRVYYDQLYDVAAPNRGWFVTNDLDVLFQTLSNRLLVGGRYSLTLPLYGERHFDPALPTHGIDNSSHRLGPFFAFTFKSVDGAAFNNPTAFLLVQWWLKHRFRTGVDTSQALPLIGVGFQVSGDLVPIR